MPTQMPEVRNCAAQDCYYNRTEVCHAPAITVGSGHPVCDTFIYRSDDHGMPAANGSVGACHEGDCKFNDLLMCHAGSINVDYHLGHPDCVTYDPRQNIEETPDIELAEETAEVASTGSTSMHLGPPPEA